MRYILNNEGYIYDVSFGAEIQCSLGTCTEYKGKVPDGYETIDEWHDKEIDRLNAWKIVDGNLVFDENRNYKLKILYEQQSNENSCVTRKELGMSSTEEINPYTDLFPSHQSAGGYITGLSEAFNKVGNLPTEEVNLSLLEEQDLDLIELEFIGNNFLPNTATSSVNNGVEYTQNKDKTINVSGTATDRSILNLAGTDTSVRNILTFKANENYLLFGLEELSLEFYHYDGSDRTSVGIYNNGIISFEEDVNITQVVLVVDKGMAIDTTIKPMITLVGLEHPILPMKKYRGNLFDKDIAKENYYYDNNGKKTSMSTTFINQKISDISKQITISFKNVVNGEYGVPYIRICEFGNNDTFIKRTVVSKKTTITLDNGTKYIIASVDDSTSNGYFEELQIEEGTKETEYKEYNGRNGQYYVDGVSTQETSKQGKNIVPTDFSEWESGQYHASTGLKVTSTTRIRVNRLIKVQPSTNYYAKTDKYDFALREYDATGTFVRSIGGIGSSVGSGFTTSANGYYVGVFIYEGVDYDTFKTDWENVKPFICLKSETDKTYEEYIPNSPSPDYPSEIINIYKAGTYNAVINNRIYEITIDEDLRGLSNDVGDRLWIDVNGDNGIDIERKVGRGVLNGSENLIVETAYDGYIRFKINAIFNEQIIKNAGMNNYFKQRISEAHGDYEYLYIQPYSKSLYIQILPSRLNENSVNGFKTWLSTHNTELYYELATYTTSPISRFFYYGFEYEEYKNNTTLIDLAGNEFTIENDITIKDNQIILTKGNGVEIYLGNTVMPRTYTPYTYAYCHQKVWIDFKYKDPRNVDITKINLKGLVLITDVETDYNFCEEDLTRVQNYIMGTGDLTNEELDVYDINGDGVVTSYDYVLIRGMINGTISNKVTGELEINSTQSKRTIVLKDKDGKILTSVGINGISTPALSVGGGEVYGEFLLFEGDTKENVTLSDNVSNYKYIEIYFKDNSGMYNSTKIYEPNNKKAVLTIIECNDADNYFMNYKSKNVTISGDMITNQHYGELNFKMSTKSIYAASKSNVIYITRVVGYRSETVQRVKENEEPETSKEEIIEVNKTSTITGSTSDNAKWTFKTEVTEKKVDTVNKTSTVTITNYIGRASSSSYFMGTLTNNYKCGDQIFSETVYRNSGTISSGGWYKLGSHTFTIKHTTEPMKINVGGSMSTTAFNPNSASANGSITLTEI